MSTKIAKHMTWHNEDDREPTVMCHLSDGETRKTFHTCHPSFAIDPQNVRLGLSLDGFPLYGQTAHLYSCWPKIATPYNLPPSVCMKNPYMFLTLIILGPKNPRQNIDL